MSNNLQSRLGSKAHAVFGAAVFLVAILAFLVIDTYHRARRIYRGVTSHNNLRNMIFRIASGCQPYHQFADRDETGHGYYYHWRVGTMLRVHLEDTVTIGLYFFLFFIICLLFGVWVVQYWTARWLFG
ncbi:uncharacterized protein BKA55DRAFT_218818 [Fusarium redolens]|uniref:Uncharacterized protein n=1 Tax=Fusarium redolens TaxID=48865 RepID=A0A9P9JTT3_FUSRE|nr:uncharacterized protein BKA55DRAFT_218818 [Fusarium redolens]KAH7216987.1 hypothetical protein BKA55DRAFT_218818 [Fusarium redolens]